MTAPSTKDVTKLTRRSINLLTHGTRRRQVGLPPGTPVFFGEPTIEKVQLSVIDYSEDTLEEADLDSAEALFPYRDRKTVTWINVNGVHDVDVIAKLGNHFDLHPLVQEDIANTSQRPKLEDYESQFYMVLRMIRCDEDTGAITSEQMSLVLRPNCVITFQEREGDVFGAVRERIRAAKGRIRKMGADYLFYAGAQMAVRLPGGMGADARDRRRHGRILQETGLALRRRARPR